MLAEQDKAWEMYGECMLAWVRVSRRARAQLPEGLHRVSGPVLVLAERYISSPLGAHLCFAIAEPAMLKLHLGWCFTTVAVNDPDVRVAERLTWGLPAQLGKLRWGSVGATRELEWVEQGVVMSGVPKRMRFPVVIPMRSVQHRSDGGVLSPGRMRGLARSAKVTIDGGEDYSWLSGTHKGLMIGSMRMRLSLAKHPGALVAGLRSPLGAPEPRLHPKGLQSPKP